MGDNMHTFYDATGKDRLKFHTQMAWVDEKKGFDAIIQIHAEEKSADSSYTVLEFDDPDEIIAMANMMKKEAVARNNLSFAMKHLPASATAAIQLLQEKGVYIRTVESGGWETGHQLETGERLKRYARIYQADYQNSDYIVPKGRDMLLDVDMVDACERHYVYLIEHPEEGLVELAGIE